MFVIEIHLLFKNPVVILGFRDRILDTVEIIDSFTYLSTCRSSNYAFERSKSIPCPIVLGNIVIVHERQGQRIKHLSVYDKFFLDRQ